MNGWAVVLSLLVLMGIGALIAVMFGGGPAND